ncbi:LCP family protein [Streptomyces sp. ME19-01-6]|uniref:LCP family protein n=1 Tax=Streptomyces sp. ME19-01-6 TaxID=3028686 RepID=UPI0029ACD4D6|nr:LytR C-terminal domain-containing protein [Streptomyces sp. ME19-01-6]MDX3224254.1 LytR C-terminal domain-containing protein [Streptomyces sp. ME19-01-6]
MNDRQDPYDPYARDSYPQDPQIYGYDAYGRPVYQPQDAQQGYDPYAQEQPQEGYGYDPYAQQQTQQQYGQAQPQPQYDDPYAGQQQYPHQHDPHQPQQGYVPQSPLGGAPYAPYDSPQGPPPGSAPGSEQDPSYGAAPYETPSGADARTGSQAGRQPADQSDGEPYHTEQFSFVEEPDEDSEDVIDWLKFAETRTERRDERKRKGRNRVVALVVVMVLAAVGGVGYLWYAGKLPGLSDDEQGPAAAGGPQKRDVIVVNLRETKGGRTSTALLVDNETTKKGTTVLLPNSLALSTEDGGSTTLGKSVVDEGSDATRDSLSTLLGSKIQGTWRLDTPYLENLVEMVGGITVDADTTVPGAAKGDDPLVQRGKQRDLSGEAAVAYATYRGQGEAQTKQLARFGQVMHAALKKISSDPSGATTTVESLAQIPDPSLSEKELGASLARLAEQAKGGSYDTTMLPVQPDGTLSERTTDQVKTILGGAVKNADQDAAPRVSVKNAGSVRGAANEAQVALVNGGFTVVGATEQGGTPQAASQVLYADAKQAAQAKEVAKTLGLGSGAAKKGKVASNADITVLLGPDYKPKS